MPPDKINRIKEIQIEVKKRGKTQVVTLMFSYIRGPRGRKKLLGEAFASEYDTPITYFKMDKVKTEEEAYQSLLHQLAWRGYLPTIFRQKTARPRARWSAWTDVDVSGINLDDVKRKHAVEILGEEMSGFATSTAEEAFIISSDDLPEG